MNKTQVKSKVGENIPNNKCVSCQSEICHPLCGKLRIDFDRSWRETYLREPKYEIIKGRLERVN